MLFSHIIKTSYDKKLKFSIKEACQRYKRIKMQPNIQINNSMLQVTDKTRADIKGGTLIQYEGKVIFPKLNICSHMSIYISGKTGGKVYSIYEAKFS